METDNDGAWEAVTTALGVQTNANPTLDEFFAINDRMGQEFSLITVPGTRSSDGTTFSIVTEGLPT